MLVVVLAVAKHFDTLPEGLNATYFSEIAWTSVPVRTTIDRTPGTDALAEAWHGSPPEVFSTTWVGSFTALRDGDWTFATASDDGSWVYVDGRLVVDNGGPHSSRLATGSMHIERGVHAIFIKYFQSGVFFHFELLWARGAAPLEPVPAWALFPQRMEFSRLLVSVVVRRALPVAQWFWLGTLVVAAVAAMRRPFERMIQFVSADRTRRAMACVIAGSLVLNIVGIWWALPNTRGWAVDELVPADVLDALGSQFSHGWYDKYPPLHYAVVSLADTPMLLLSWLGLLDLQTPGPHMGLFLIGRLVSVVFGAGTVMVVYLCGRELYGPRGAVFAALTAALMAPFAYYGKLTNLEVPYMFWFAVSLLAYIRILKHHARSDYLLFAASAALAVCTKDQAYGLFVLTPLAILVARWRRWRSAGGPVLHVVFDGTTLLAAGVAVGIFLVADNLLFNFSGFVAHVKVILGPASSDYQMFPGTVAGQLRMASLAMLELRYMFGWPLALIVAIAVAWGLARTTTSPSLRWLLVPPLSYYLTFIGVVLYFFDRFLLPIGLVLSLFAGGWLERFVAPGVPARRLRIALVSAAFAYSVTYVAMVDYAMINDSRYVVTRWLKAHAGQDHAIAALGAPLEYFALADGFASTVVESVQDIVEARPAFIVLNPDQIASLSPADPVRTMYDALRDGRVAYRLALRYRTPSLPWPGRHPDLGDTPRQPEFSSLSRINPTLEVFERVEAASNHSIDTPPQVLAK